MLRMGYYEGCTRMNKDAFSVCIDVSFYEDGSILDACSFLFYCVCIYKFLVLFGDSVILKFTTFYKYRILFILQHGSNVRICSRS
jgi:hypothetical protein